MSLQQLQYFVAAAEEQQVTRAAERALVELAGSVGLRDTLISIAALRHEQ